METRSVLITGTTSGVGGALLDHYASRGTSVIAVNRRPVPELRARYPAVRFECVDVRDAAAVQALVERLSDAGELPETLILNAGINRVDNDESFDLAEYRSVMETNLYGVLHFVAPLTRLPSGQGSRHVVAISSMAHYAGNPYGLGYFTSKRALTTCFEVWSEMYSGTDLVFQQVLLGPVPSAIHTMSDRFPDWVVGIRDLVSGSLDEAARAIARFARTRRKKLFYPWRAAALFSGLWLGQKLDFGGFRGRKTLDGKARRTRGDERQRQTPARARPLRSE